MLRTLGLCNPLLLLISTFYLLNHTFHCKHTDSLGICSVFFFLITYLPPLLFPIILLVYVISQGQTKTKNQSWHENNKRPYLYIIQQLYKVYVTDSEVMVFILVPVFSLDYYVVHINVLHSPVKLPEKLIIWPTNGIIWQRCNEHVCNPVSFHFKAFTDY